MNKYFSMVLLLLTTACGLHGGVTFGVTPQSEFVEGMLGTPTIEFILADTRADYAVVMGSYNKPIGTIKEGSTYTLPVYYRRNCSESGYGQRSYSTCYQEERKYLVYGYKTGSESPVGCAIVSVTVPAEWSYQSQKSFAQVSFSENGRCSEIRQSY